MAQLAWITSVYNCWQTKLAASTVMEDQKHAAPAEILVGGVGQAQKKATHKDEKDPHMEKKTQIRRKKVVKRPPI